MSYNSVTDIKVINYSLFHWIGLAYDLGSKGYKKHAVNIYEHMVKYDIKGTVIMIFFEVRNNQLKPRALKPRAFPTAFH